MERSYDMVILGGGPGGYTAAMYAARAGLKAVVLEKLSAGGQMALTAQVDNYPGFPEGIDGFELGMRMQEQAEGCGAVTEYAEVTGLELKADPKIIHTSAGDYYGKTLVYALGAGPRKLGLEQEERLAGRGVNYCAHCDGMFYRDKVVAVIGGGDSAVAEALFLSRVAKKVTVIHRRDSLRAAKANYDQLLNRENVEFVWNSAVTGLLGEDRLTGLQVVHLPSGQVRQLPVDGVFVSIGRKPVTELVAGQLRLENGYILAGEDTVTSIPGVYAVGDVRTKALRQIITAAADGANAVHAAQEFLESR